MSATYAIFAFQLVAFIILVALMHDLYRKLRRDDARPAAGGPDTAQMRAGVDEMVAELRRAADRINADILARAGTLQKLVDEADQKLRQLDAAVARADGARPAARPLGRPAPPPMRPAAPPPTTASRPATSLLPLGEGQHEGVAPAPRPSVRPHPGPLPEGEGTRAQGQTTKRTAPSVAAPTPAQAQPPADEPWPGAPASQPTRTLPRVAPAAGAAGSAYRQAARATVGAAPAAASADGSQAAGAEAATARARADEFLELGLDEAGKFQTVRRLSDQGLSAAEIARQARLGREEVELIMQLSGEARS